MARKWNSQDWYRYHKNKAAEAAISTYASAEKSALDVLDAKIADLDRERKSLEATQSGWSGLLASLLPTQTTRELSTIRRELDRLRQERVKLYVESRDAIRSAASHGISAYNADREARAEETAKKVKERRIRYLERSPAIRSAQAAIRLYIIDEYSSQGEITCYYCKVSLQPEEIHIEHKTPVVRGGTNSRSNLALACQRCNLSKGRKTESEFRRYMEGKE